MKTYNFDRNINRRNTSSLKWDFTEQRFEEKDLLPMWVADMDFASPPEVIEALVERAKHPVYGYTSPQDDVYASIIGWMKRKHNWDIQKEWISFSAGVVSGFTAAILAFTEPGDKVLIQPPVYSPFFDSIKKNDRIVVENPLRYTDNTMEIDFEDLEEKLKEGVSVFLLCSPHNPGGKIWSKEDLQRIGELCLTYDVLILSDEIHADLSLPGHVHYPIASFSSQISDRTVTFMAPSKTFNVAGIQASVIITSNPDLRKQLSATQLRTGFHGLNLFAIETIKASYDKGLPWLEQLTSYLGNHVQIIKDFIENELPHVRMMIPDASYLVWLDCSALKLNDTELHTRLKQKGKIAISPGINYGTGGEGFIRINIGCTTETLLEGLQRLKVALALD